MDCKHSELQSKADGIGTECYVFETMSTDRFSETAEQLPDLEELMARMAMPETPREALGFAPELVSLVSGLDPLRAAPILAGLMTLPKFQANFARLDWAVRLVMGLGRGNRSPKRKNLDRLLNNGLVEARVVLLEDPAEDFFVESFPTRRGEFLLFSGYWEKAGSYTETVIQAFEALPDGEKKKETLRQAYALLRLSNELVARAGLERRVIGESVAQGRIDLPSDFALHKIAGRATFSERDIAAMGVEMNDLAPFIQSAADDTALLDVLPGNSQLEFQPMLQTERGLVVALPANLSIAVRALLIDTAAKHKLGRMLQYNLLRAQRTLMNLGNFRVLPNGPVREVDGSLIHAAVQEVSAGRYVHVIHSVDGFDGWPQRAFGGVAPCTPAWTEAILGSISQAHEEASKTEGFVEGMTVWLAGGWGAGQSFTADRDPTPPNWPLIVLEPADAVVLANCKDGKLSDAWRLIRQLKLVESQGFEFFYANGFLNLFHWWRRTDHALVPPHEIDATPPMFINFDTNELLEARREAAKEIDRRCFQHPDGSWHLVARSERDLRAEVFGSIYGSLDDASKGKLTAVIPRADSTWWVEFVENTAHVDRDVFETWRAVAMWAALVMPVLLREFEAKEVINNIRLTVSPGNFAASEDRFNVAESLSDEAIDAAIDLTVDTVGHSAHIVLGKDWYKGFYRPDNYAEISLAAAIAWGVARLFGSKRPRSDFQLLVEKVTGSRDFRHRHAFRAEQAIDQLTSLGLIKKFTSIPLSAAALAKCGSIWPSHPREKGVRIRGKADCVALLHAFVAERQGALQQDIRGFDRKSLVVAALEGLQAAIASEKHWGRSARALRAIHGVDEDFRMSLEAILRSNGVLRANSILAELAAAEAPLTKGRVAGLMDIEELQARVLQIFLSADLLPAFYADRIEPEINLSPTGDLLYSHNFEELGIQKAAELRHESERRKDSDKYIERFADPPEREEADANVTVAFAAEYGVPFELVGAFPSALVALCHERKAGVVVMRRSELITGLNSPENLAGYYVGPLVDRLILPARNGWQDLPEGRQRSDFDLSRFDRPFSLIGRPLVALSQEADPELVIAPGVVERALLHNFGGAITGTLQNDFWRSKEMRSYSGACGDRNGKQFNQEVAKVLSKLQLKAWPSAKPAWCLGLAKSQALSKLGDIDVFAISADARRVWVVEAKDLKMCRTIGEAARRLMVYRGEAPDGKPDKMLRHLQRVEFIRANAGVLVEKFKLPSVPSVCGVLVVNGPQPMQQLQGEYSSDATVVMLDRIGSVPWGTGWPSERGESAAKPFANPNTGK